jgi:hypothetical protein
MAPTPPAKDSAAPRTPAPATRSVTVPAPEDLELAKEDALLQLRIGRSAHLYAVLISAALAMDGIILLAFTSSVPVLPRSVTGFAAVNDSAFLLIPLAAGLAISVIGVTTKWEAFQLWPWEAHFSTTIGALALNVFLVIVYGTRIAGVGPFAHLAIVPGLYPAALTGISVAMIGLVMTWTSWSLRQWASALSAALPVATSVLVWVGTPGAAGATAGLAISLFLSAILFQTSGSFLHLISSGTRPHERELITSGQSRMFRLADEVRQKDEALHFREAALLKREADVENLDSSVRRQRDAIAEARQQLEDLEADYRQRSGARAATERESAGHNACWRTGKRHSSSGRRRSLVSSRCSPPANNGWSTGNRSRPVGTWSSRSASSTWTEGRPRSPRPKLGSMPDERSSTRRPPNFSAARAT